jgi:hypothetical protein
MLVCDTYHGRQHRIYCLEIVSAVTAATMCAASIRVAASRSAVTQVVPGAGGRSLNPTGWAQLQQLRRQHPWMAVQSRSKRYQ